MSKQSELDELFKNYREEFVEEEIVLDGGNIDSEIMFIGEAPGKDEVKLSKPFVGAAGKNLARFLEILQRTREEIFVGNAIKYRLSKINPKSGRKINRPPTKDEISKNSVYLMKELGILKPKYIVTLGNVPLKMVSADKNINIGNVHGTLTKINMNQEEVLLFPLYHPASVIYNAALEDTCINDIKKLKEVLERNQ